MKKLVIFALIMFAFIIDSNSQRWLRHIVQNDMIDIEKIKSENSLTYYGVDFSLISLIHPRQASRDDAMRKYLPAWLDYYNKNVREGHISRWLGYSRHNFNASTRLHNTINNVPEEWVLHGVNRKVTIEDVVEVIESYDLGNDYGIGFVIHPVEFNDPQRSANCYFTFFDIDSKEVLWITEMTVNTGRGGLTKKFGNAMVEATRFYIDYVYKRNI